MKEKDNRDHTGPINDYLQRNQYKKLEIIFEENNSLANDLNNPDMSGARTQRNFYKKYNPLQEERKEKIRNKNKSNEKLRNVNYNQDYNNNEPEQEEDSEDKEFHKIEENKRNQKVNQNLKLLRLIKEKYNNNSGKKEKEKEKEQDDKLDDEEESNVQEKNKNPYKNKYLKRKGFASFIINKKTNGNDDENKNKKLNDNQNQRVNKFKKREIDVVSKEEEIYHQENKNKNKNKSKTKSKSKSKSNSKSNSKNISRNRSRRGGNSKNKNIDYNTISASQSSFVRKGVGIFEISTPNSKISHIKNDEKEKENKNKNEQKIEKNDKKEEKYTEIPNSQRDKLTINIKPKNDKYMNNSNNNKKKINQNSNIGMKSSYTYDRDDDINVNDFNDNTRNDFNESYIVDGTNEESEIKNINEKSRDINTNYRRKKNNSNIETVIEKISIKETKNNSPNNNNSSSKKEGALKILELLKAKKKEQSKSQYSLSKKSQDTPVKQENSHRINYNESEVDKTKDEVDIQKTKDTTKNTDSSHISNQQKTNKNYAEGKFDINSLPKKTFRDEEDEDDNNYKYNDSNTKSQQQKKTKANFNRFENRKKNLINRNRSMNINNYLDLEEEQNSSERKISNYIINSSSLRTKYNKRVKEPSSTTENFNISLSPRGLDSQNINSYNSIIKNNVNIKALDKSFDMTRSKQSPLSKKILNINTNEPNSININSNPGVYEPKKISSPRNRNKRNLNNDFNNINYINSMKNIRNNANTKIYNKVNNNQSYIAYIKKSPGRFKANKNNSNGNIERPKNKRNNLYKNNATSNNVNNVNNVNIKNNSRNNVPGLIEVSSIDKINTSKDSCTSNTIDYINNKNNFGNKRNKNNNGIKSNSTDTFQKENSIMFNLEDLMVLEERLNDINLALQSNNNIDNKCFNFWNYYYNCSLYKLLEKIFPNDEDSNAIRISINYELMSIMVCYEFSFHECISIEDMYLKLLDLININHNNLMIISQYILTKISPENKNNIWVLKLQELVNNLKISQVKELNNNYSLSPIQKINNNINILIPKINDILLNYKTEYSPLLKDYLPSIESKTYEEINDFFRLNILRVDNFEGSIVASSYLKEKKDFESVPAPYIKEPSKKKYTLVLDLDETLVNFKIKSNKEGILRARPFLFGFLEEMGVYYELIVWTSATEAYANTLLDAIECEKTYFDYVFYREHAIIVGDDFVKDLNRIGRPLDRVIIVDDMPQNFRLQRQNGITIKPFLGDDNSDMALYYLLPILKNIAEEGNDVRVELAKYRDEIVKKITSNISKHNI